MNIRKSTENDLAEVLSLWYQNLDILYRPFQKELQGHLAEGKYFILEEDGQIIGFTTYKIMPRKKCTRISHFCVALSFRDKGGRILLNRLFNELQTLDIKLDEYPIQVETIEGATDNQFWLREGKEVARRVIPSGKTILTIQIGDLVNE